MTPPNQLLLLGSVLALAACGPRSAPSLAIPPADPLSELRRGPFVAGHLYVSFSGDSDGPIARYPIVDGVPGADPDLTYPANLAGVFGVVTDGTLRTRKRRPHTLTTSTSPSSDRTRTNLRGASSRIRNRTRRTRPASSVVRASSISPSSKTRPPGDNSAGASRYSRVRFSASPFTARKPTTLAPYLTCFATTFGAMENGISLGPDGNLYSLSRTPSNEPAVDVYENPSTRPTLLRTMYGDSFAGASGIANDDAGHLYVPATHGRDRAFIGVYDDTDTGPDKPARAFDFREPQTRGNANVAVDDRYVYVSTVGEVLVFDKLARGYARPVATLCCRKSTFPQRSPLGRDGGPDAGRIVRSPRLELGT